MHKSFTLSRLGLAVVMLTIVIGPFFQGYFFPNPTLVAMAAVAGGFILWAVGRRQQGHGLNLTGDWTGRLLIGLTVWILLATAWAVYARDNLALLLQTFTAFLAFTLVRAENSEGVRRAFVGLLSLSAVVVAVLGLLEYAGFFMEHMALGELLRIEPQQGRLFTVFQYPNSAAIFFLAAILLQNARLIISESWVEKIALATGSAVIATALVLTLSRGAVIIAPVAVVLLWVGLPIRQVVPSLLHFIAAVVLPAALSVFPITQAASADDWQRVLLWALAAALVGALVTGLVHTLHRLPGRAQTAVAAGLLVILLAAGIAAAPRAADQLPRVFARITQMNPQTLTESARFEYLRDAGRLAARRPWGYGGGGWLRTYAQVQQLNYVARDPHSHYALTLVEAGVPGVILLLGAIATASWSAFRVRRGDPLRWAMSAAALAVAGHASMDIDLSYYALWLLVWLLLALAQPVEKPLPLKKEPRFIFPGAISAALVALLMASSFAAAGFSYDRATVAVLLGDNETAIQLGERAITLDPWNSQFRTLIPTTANINRALQLDPQNEELWRFVAQLSRENGDHPGAIAALKKALDLRPMSVTRYEELASLLSDQMTAALENGAQDEAVEYAQDLLALGEAVMELGPPTLERQKQLFRYYPSLTMTPPLNLAVGQAELILGDTEAAVAKLSIALQNPASASEAALWLHALYTRTDNTEALASLEPQPDQDSLKSALYRTLLNIQ